jgi:hypothetical protein
MNGFNACGTGARSVPPDPTKRVNFVRGLVLGADELTQESTYLANRAEWLARDLLGAGTVMGLRVSRETRPNGAAIVVGGGSAVSPRGRPIRVTQAQALTLDEWLDARRHEIVSHLVPGDGSPPGDHLKLFVVLAYEQCATDDQPAPGEPCRTDESPRISTRLADDFRLELRFEAPRQPESDATRGFVSWLEGIEYVDRGPTVTIDEFLAALRTAALSGGTFDPVLSSPPEPLLVHVADAADFLRAAFVVWTTEFKPLLRTVAPDDDALLLAEVDLPVRAAPSGRWVVDDAARIAVFEERRPYVVSLRLLQELILSLRSTLTSEWARTFGGALSLPFTVVAAGIVAGDPSNRTNRRPLLNGLRVTAVSDGVVSISFDGYEQPSPQGDFQYIVKATSGPRVGTTVPTVINIGGFDATSIRLIVVLAASGKPVPAADLRSFEMTVEVMRYPSEKRS